jgi:hypothetical protein
MNIPEWMEDGSLSWSEKKEENPSQPQQPYEEESPTTLRLLLLFGQIFLI